MVRTMGLYDESICPCLSTTLEVCLIIEPFNGVKQQANYFLYSGQVSHRLRKVLAVIIASIIGKLTSANRWAVFRRQGNRGCVQV